jgi:hypothetical protein
MVLALAGFTGGCGSSKKSSTSASTPTPATTPATTPSPTSPSTTGGTSGGATQYAQQFQQISQQFQQKEQQIIQQVSGGGADVAAKLKVISQLAQVLDDYASRISQLQPPAAAQQAQQKLVDAIHSAAAVIRDLKTAAEQKDKAQLQADLQKLTQSLTAVTTAATALQSSLQ